MRNTGIVPDEKVPAFDKIGSVPVSRRTPEERSQDLDNALSWIRNGRPESDDPTGEFKKIDQLLPPKKNQPSEDRARDIHEKMVSAHTVTPNEYCSQSKHSLWILNVWIVSVVQFDHTSLRSLHPGEQIVTLLKRVTLEFSIENPWQAGFHFPNH